METEHSAVVACWQRLKERYDWQMIGDEAAFVDQVVTRLAEPGPPADQSGRRIEAAIVRLYNDRLYTAFFEGVRVGAGPQAIADANRASLELTRFMRRQPALLGYSESIQNDVIQQVFLRLVSAPNPVKSPESLMGWVMWQVRTSLKAVMRDRRPIASLDVFEANDAAVADPMPQLDRVDRLLRNKELDWLLRGLLSPFQRNVVVLTMIEQRSEREAALMLDVEVTRVYREKSRARQKLINSPRLMRFLSDDHEIALVRLSQLGAAEQPRLDRQ